MKIYNIFCFMALAWMAMQRCSDDDDDDDYVTLRHLTQLDFCVRERTWLVLKNSSILYFIFYYNLWLGLNQKNVMCLCCVHKKRGKVSAAAFCIRSIGGGGGASSPSNSNVIGYYRYDRPRRNQLASSIPSSDLWD